VKRLCEKLGLEFENSESWDFLESVENVKKRLMFKGECTTQ